MKHIALLINTFQARFEPVGPFASVEAAQAWIDKQVNPREWAALPMKPPA